MATVAARTTVNSALDRAAAVWLLAALAGQWAFFAYLAVFYGTTTLTGDFAAWNRLAVVGVRPFVAGDTGGNLAFAAHALGAALVALGGALQLIPRIRARAPAFHRWNGRIFIATVLALALSGFYLVWIRGSSTSAFGAIATTINGVLIVVFALRTFVTARARELAAHRRWALRLYLVANAQWFTRVGVFAYLVVARVAGYAPTFRDPFIAFWNIGCWLVPLVVLELYLRAREGRSTAARHAMAGMLVVLTLLMAVGIFAFGAFSQMLVSGRPLAPGG